MLAWQVQVYRKPVVALFSTGNEIVDLQSASEPSRDDWGGIYDTNRPSLRAALEGMGYEVVDLGIAPDRYDLLPLGRALLNVRETEQCNGARRGDQEWFETCRFTVDDRRHIHGLHRPSEAGYRAPF